MFLIAQKHEWEVITNFRFNKNTRKRRDRANCSIMYGGFLVSSCISSPHIYKPPNRGDLHLYAPVWQWLLPGEDGKQKAKTSLEESNRRSLRGRTKAETHLPFSWAKAPGPSHTEEELITSASEWQTFDISQSWFSSTGFCPPAKCTQDGEFSLFDQISLVPRGLKLRLYFQLKMVSVVILVILLFLNHTRSRTAKQVKSFLQCISHNKQLFLLLFLIRLISK